MANQDGPIIDMTRSGEFIDPPKPSLGTIAARIAAFGVLLLVAAVAGYFVLRHQMKRGGFVVTRRF